jgi:hypothetical protein
MEPDKKRQLGIIQTVINTVCNLLLKLSGEFDFHFAINYALLERKTKKIIDFRCLTNVGITNPCVELFTADMENLLIRRKQTEMLIFTGEVIVTCINDINRPQGIKDWLNLGESYLVDAILPTKVHGECVYILRGMDSTPYKGYKSERFGIQLNDYNKN